MVKYRFKMWCAAFNSFTEICKKILKQCSVNRFTCILRILIYINNSNNKNIFYKVVQKDIFLHDIYNYLQGHIKEYIIIYK